MTRVQRMRKISSMENWEVLQRLNVAERYDLKDLAGIAELAELFSVSPTVITSWNSRRESHNFPLPVLRFRSGPVFSISEYLVAWNDWIPKKGAKSGVLSEWANAVLQESILKIKQERGSHDF